MNNQTDLLSLAITKALAYTENGGKPSVRNIKSGRSGELKSLFQFEPATWKAYSKQVTGKDDLPVTPENEAAVAYGKVSQWVDQFIKEGKNPWQVATAIGSLWNSGHTDPNIAGSGINKSGVKFDAPAYAKKVANYTTQFLKQPTLQKTNSGLLASNAGNSAVPGNTAGMLSPAPEPQLGGAVQGGMINA